MAPVANNPTKAVQARIIAQRTRSVLGAMNDSSESPDDAPDEGPSESPPAERPPHGLGGLPPDLADKILKTGETPASTRTMALYVHTAALHSLGLAIHGPRIW